MRGKNESKASRGKVNVINEGRKKKEWCVCYVCVATCA